MEDRGDLEPRLRDQVALDGVDRLGELLGRLVPDQAERGNMPNAVLSRASSWPRFVPSVVNSAKG